MNQTTIAGHLGADPEVRFTSTGKKVTTLRVATKVRRTSKDETIWWRVSVWGEEFDKILSFFKKGSAIIVVGELNKPEIFTDKEGKPQVSMSMTGFNVMFSPFGGTSGAGAGSGKPENMTQESSYHSGESNNYGMNESSAYGQAKVGASMGASMGNSIGSSMGGFSEDEIPF